MGRSRIRRSTGAAAPQRCAPRLVELHAEGRLPVERLVTRFAFEDIAGAFEAARAGAAIKPLLTFG